MALPTNTTQTPTGIITKMIDWIMHPIFTDSDPLDWLAFATILVMGGLLWSKVVKQTLDAKI
jgi:hypothetical protein